MFDENSFQVFEVEGLEARMKAIVEKIQPLFKTVGEKDRITLEEKLHEPLFLHIAQHRRRTTYAPESTWCAISSSKRGYKRYPHFQIAINEDYLAAWLSFIDNPDNEKEMAQKLLDNQERLLEEFEGFVINQDHTKKEVVPLNQQNLVSSLVRWRDVKKGEFQIGRIIERTEIEEKKEEVEQLLIQTHVSLVPIYQLVTDYPAE